MISVFNDVFCFLKNLVQFTWCVFAHRQHDSVSDKHFIPYNSVCPVISKAYWLLFKSLNSNLHTNKRAAWHNLARWCERNSRPEVFYQKAFLSNFTKFTRNHLCQSLFFNKVAGISKFLRTPLLTEHLRWLFLIWAFIWRLSYVIRSCFKKFLKVISFLLYHIFVLA